jgi:hydrogenase-4 component E
LKSLIDPLLVVVALLNLAMLVTGRLRACIRLAAWQGVALGVLALPLSHDGVGFRLVFVAIITIVLKGWLFPTLLLRATRTADVKREAEPYVGPAASALAGVGMLMLSVWLGSRFELPVPTTSPLVLPMAFFSVLAGLFLIISRRTAVMQVVGYLVLENGIFIFGVAMAHEEPLMVEMGVLLDVFVAVFVMGIAIFHISREFDHIDVDQLSTLRD